MHTAQRVMTIPKNIAYMIYTKLDNRMNCRKIQRFDVRSQKRDNHWMFQTTTISPQNNTTKESWYLFLPTFFALHPFLSNCLHVKLHSLELVGSQVTLHNKSYQKKKNIWGYISQLKEEVKNKKKPIIPSPFHRAFAWFLVCYLVVEYKVGWSNEGVLAVHSVGMTYRLPLIIEALL